MLGTKRIRSKEEQRQLLYDIKGTFESPEGKRVLEWLKEEFFIYGPAVTFPSIDANALIYNEGQRNVVLHILSTLNVEENLYESGAATERYLHDGQSESGKPRWREHLPS